MLLPALAQNLKTACAQRRSISEVCRDIGLNRQQFNRYVNGKATPSPYNMQRIADYFGLAPDDFHLLPGQFLQKLASPPESAPPSAGLLSDGFPGELAPLRRHLGFYQTYHLSLSWPGKVVCSCAQMSEVAGSVHVKSIERIRDRQAEISQFSKYIGLAAYWRGKIFVVERTVGEFPLIAQTILSPFAEHQKTYLKGITVGVSWRQNNMPYASRMIWRYVGANPDLRALLGRCDMLDPRSRRLPPMVRNYLQEDGTFGGPLAAG
ncbi:helix-turn-helix domain-containing protein [Roseibium limicola]|uniref:Helix-turn-helix transcriptional regulator n=1 Tax=Roseibium limicola TaxID=2816037 RepID=A0A939J7E9_9HYPH|nr:helix-turn-helix transcriptional regulator [Roseibium limicola]MBO0344151.1 helix-turn-helix transcriptional regulator [Roseibium limicola]